MTAMSAQAQKIQVVDTDGNAIPLVSVLTEDGTYIGTTDLNGVLADVKGAKKVAVTHVAYKPQLITVASLQNGRITMEEIGYDLAEIVVKPKQYIYVEAYYRVYVYRNDSLCYFLSGIMPNAYGKWYVIDATDLPLGRLASAVALILMGKNKPTWTPNVDCGDYVIIVNAEKVGLSGDKLHNKKYYNVSGYAGGLRVRTAKEMVEKFPTEMIERSVHGMVPKGRLGRQIEKKLFVYAGPDHKHEAQKPEVLELKF